MNPTSSTFVKFTQTLAFAGLYALGLAACGSSPDPIGEHQQPISDDASDEASGDACQGGVATEAAAAGECSITARGLCFTSRAAACACAGCGLDECAIAESFPEQAICPSSGGGSGGDEPVTDDPNAPVSSEPGGGVSGSPGGGSDGHPGCGTPGHEPPSDAGACADGHSADADGRCDFVVGDACFDSAESACACAGCELDACVVLESYPAQIRCQ
ncbi:MAG TPA: hypothetical protein VMG12_41200 [Polyangiaceae bacterium]|nr:hypothetical protein [Polyangiaceae bacterium]